ncbi:MAG TPA: response regulator [Bryobacteraceae bacterium]|nr:response regulator [Bryobacteraceae bacterium]
MLNARYQNEKTGQAAILGDARRERSGMKKILIADDKASSRELIRTVLEQSGHSVVEAIDGKEALRKADESLPDLILLDLHMPRLDGVGTLQELRRDQRFAATPIVALTASAMQGDRERALSAGFTGYIAKPIGLKALRNEVNRFLSEDQKDLRLTAPA